MKRIHFIKGNVPVFSQKRIQAFPVVSWSIRSLPATNINTEFIMKNTNSANGNVTVIPAKRVLTAAEKIERKAKRETLLKTIRKTATENVKNSLTDEEKHELASFTPEAFINFSTKVDAEVEKILHEKKPRKSASIQDILNRRMAVAVFHANEFAVAKKQDKPTLEMLRIAIESAFNNPTAPTKRTRKAKADGNEAKPEGDADKAA